MDGFNLHAGVALSALDRDGRERLCRYLLRPPISDDRLTLLADGRVQLALKSPWRDGTMALILTPEQLVARLAALVPRPGKNLIRYAGILAPNAHDRADIVPAVAEPTSGDTPPGNPPEVKRRSGRHLAWAELMRRVFEIDVLACPRCGGRLKLVCAIVDGLSARRYLQGVAQRKPEPEARPPPADASTTAARA